MIKQQMVSGFSNTYRNMKRGFIITLICAGVFSNAGCKKKKPEFLLVGVFHNIPDSLSCNWQSAYDKILKYHPDQIAVEWLTPADTASMPHQFGNNYKYLWDSVMIAWESKIVNAADSISHYYRLLEKNDDDKLRLQLWRYYHLGLDLGNRDYQTYLLHKGIKNNGRLPDTATTIGQAFWTRYKQTLSNRKDGEFFRLVFPIAEELGIRYLHPTDDRVTYPAQSEAWGKFTEKIKGTAIQNKIDSFWKAFVETEQQQITACNSLAFVNSGDWLKNSDYGQAHIADDMKNKDFADYSAVWYKRNKSIAARIVASAKKSNAKKMVIFYGYMHVYPVKKYLEDEGYSVKLLGDLQ
jgi:hypothetical protein